MFHIALKRLLRSALLAGGIIFFLGIAGAAPAYADTPSRAARVAQVWGQAWLFDPEEKEWTPITRNQTIAEGDRIRTDALARLSLRIGSTSLWLGERGDIAISRLDDQRVLLNLGNGELGLQFRSQEIAKEYSVQTREGLVFVEQEGLFHIKQLDRGTMATPLSGRLRFEFRPDASGSAQRVWLREGEQVEFWWASGPRTERQPLQGDAFKDWIAEQSRADQSSTANSQRYVSPEMTGAEDLDRHGRWEQSTEYGNVWIPITVAADWAPYRNGQWSWSIQWGWTWVDAAPWGFAPFHYGRWVEWRGRWCWAPGRYEARPTYAPALVTWGGSNASIGVRVGVRPPQPHAWHPLAPKEVYKPAFSHNEAYWERINRGHGDPMPRTPSHAPSVQPESHRSEPLAPQRWMQPQPAPQVQQRQEIPVPQAPSRTPYRRERPTDQTPTVTAPARPTVENRAPQTPPAPEVRPPSHNPKNERHRPDKETEKER